MNQAQWYARACRNIDRLFRSVDGEAWYLGKAEKAALRKLAWRMAAIKARGGVWQANGYIANDPAFPQGEVWGISECCSQYDLLEV